MRIAYVITRADAVGGASIHVRDLAEAMIAQGHEVRVFIGGSGAVTQQLAAVGVPFTSLRYLQRAIHPLRDGLAYFELRSALKQFAPDVVSTHTAKAGFVGRAAAYSLRLPVIYTPHGLAVSDRISTKQGALFTRLERTAARWTAAIVCVSEYEQKLALEKGIGRVDQVMVIHNGVKETGFRHCGSAAGEAVRLVSVARFEAPKDHATLLRALGELRDLDWTLTLVGDGPNEPAVRSLATELAIADRVRFAGYRADPAADLADADIFLLCSRSESFPRSILEAMRARLPVVASDVGGVREAVVHGESGFLVNKAQHEEWIKPIKTLILEAVTRQRMGAVGHHIYVDRFRFERMVQQTTYLYAFVGKSTR